MYNSSSQVTDRTHIQYFDIDAPASAKISADFIAELEEKLRSLVLRLVCSDLSKLVKFHPGRNWKIMKVAS